MKLAVCIVSHPTYIHSEAFREVAQTLLWALAELGHDVVMTDRALVPDRRTIVLGSNLLSRFPQPVPDDAILYNLEQVESSRWFDESHLALLRTHQVWDYSPRNARALELLGVPRVTVVPIGWAPCLRRIELHLEPSIDVLFYGSMNERRNLVINELKARGVAVVPVFSIYGAGRDDLISKAAIVLNLHYFDLGVFELVRVSYLLANGCAVVSEGYLAADEIPFQAGVAFAPYSRLADVCCALLKHPTELDKLAKAGQRIIESRPMTQYLAAVLP